MTYQEAQDLAAQHGAKQFTQATVLLPHVVQVLHD